MRLSQPSGASIAAAGSSPVDCSPYDILDMAGNVSEWCETRYRIPPESESHIQVTMNLDLPEVDRVVRGGAWTSIPQQCLAAGRLPAWPDSRSEHISFRLVRSLG
jgi:formylglycine-generating enzyme required for sulfatase activity